MKNLTFECATGSLIVSVGDPMVPYRIPSEDTAQITLRQVDGHSIECILKLPHDCDIAREILKNKDQKFKITIEAI